MPEPDADALPTISGEPAPPALPVLGLSATDVRALDAALRMCGLSSRDASHLRVFSPVTLTAHGQGAPAAVVLLVTEPFETLSELAGAGVDGPSALALWERYHRLALAGLRGLAVFVTSPKSASNDRGWGRDLQAFLERHGVAASGAAPLSPFAPRPASPGATAIGNDEPCAKDEGLLLVSQQQLASLLEQLLGPHDRFDPPAPEPESPWVAAVLERGRDLGQLWQGLDWAARELALLETAAENERDRRGSEPYPANATEDLPAYQGWLRRRGEPTALPLSGGLPVARARRHLRAPPQFSVVVPVYRPPAWALERCVASVLAQSHGGFQLVLADDASREAALEEQLRSFAHLDPRVELVFRDENGGISAATNSALEHARGEHVVFLDHDDELHPRALEAVAAAIAEHPEADVLYSDEDKLSPAGERCVPTLKPDWSPDLLLSCAYLCHLLVVRRSLVEELGGLRSEFDGSQDYDLMLRATETARAVVHVPEILYHWRELPGSASGDTGAKPWAYEAGRRTLEETLARRGIEGVVEPHARFLGNFHVRRAIRGEPLVSIVVPFRDEPARMAACYRSLLEAPGYANFEIVLVDNGSELPETRALTAELAADPNVRLLRHPKAFNWAARNNDAATEARGEVLVFVDPAVKARSEGWLAAMLGHAQREDVGAVGALLRHADSTVSHAGIVAGMSPAAAYVQRNLPFDRPGYLLMTGITRNCSAVSGACLMTRRSCFEELGGFDTRLERALSDVDYCLRLRREGRLVIFTPLAELFDFAAGDGGFPDTEEPLFKQRWRDELREGDPYYSRNLTRSNPYCSFPAEEEPDQ
jgi:O-antigen biosynthesis protein